MSWWAGTKKEGRRGQGIYEEKASRDTWLLAFCLIGTEDSFVSRRLTCISVDNDRTVHSVQPHWYLSTDHPHPIFSRNQNKYTGHPIFIYDMQDDHGRIPESARELTRDGSAGSSSRDPTISGIAAPPKPSTPNKTQWTRVPRMCELERHRHDSDHCP